MLARPGRVLIEADEISRRVEELNAEINRFYCGSPVHIVGVLDGCLLFLADLIRRLEMPLELSLVRVKTYENARPAGEPAIPEGELSHLRGARVLVVDDIYDTGATLAALARSLRAAGAEEVRLCALLEKEKEHDREVGVDFLGFRIEDVFVVGYGLDYDGLYRNLPHIAELEHRDEGRTIV